MSLTTVKLLLNSIVSTINSHFMTIDIKDFYFNTLMARELIVETMMFNSSFTVVKLTVGVPQSPG